MDVETLMGHCAALPGAWADHPWEHEHPVFKVGPGERGKIFAFCREDSVGLKCGDRAEADEWLQRYPDDAAVMKYIGRSGWNDLLLAGRIPDDELLEALLESYARVVEKLPKSLRPSGWEDAVKPSAEGPRVGP